MSMQETETTRIPPEVLDEQWFAFMHRLIGGMQSAYRASGVTQKLMAARLGKKASFISRCLSGQQNMTVRTIHDVGRSMGYRIDIYFRPLSSLVPANRQPPATIEQLAPARTATADAPIQKVATEAQHAGGASLTPITTLSELAPT